MLLNTWDKLIEKVVSQCMQFQTVQIAFIHPNQLGGVIQRLTTNAGSFLTHAICAEWVKCLKTNVVAFDIVQFFPSLNHNYHKWPLTDL